MYKHLLILIGFRIINIIVIITIHEHKYGIINYNVKKKYMYIVHIDEMNV